MAHKSLQHREELLAAAEAYESIRQEQLANKKATSQAKKVAKISSPKKKI